MKHHQLSSGFHVEVSIGGGGHNGRFAGLISLLHYFKVSRGDILAGVGQRPLLPSLNADAMSYLESLGANADYYDMKFYVDML